MAKAEDDFIEQFARVLLVQWCVQTLSTSTVGISNPRDAGGYDVSQAMAKLCMDLASEKGWVGKSEPKKVLAKGFSTAAAFLRR
jgi:hypothetical protein